MDDLKKQTDYKAAWQELRKMLEAAEKSSFIGRIPPLPMENQ